MIGLTIKRFVFTSCGRQEISGSFVNVLKIVYRFRQECKARPTYGYGAQAFSYSLICPVTPSLPRRRISRSLGSFICAGLQGLFVAFARSLDQGIVPDKEPNILRFLGWSARFFLIVQKARRGHARVEP